jgi:hypothetical protein
VQKKRTQRFEKKSDKFWVGWTGSLFPAINAMHFRKEKNMSVKIKISKRETLTLIKRILGDATESQWQ